MVFPEQVSEFAAGYTDLVAALAADFASAAAEHTVVSALVPAAVHTVVAALATAAVHMEVSALATAVAVRMETAVLVAAVHM